MPSSSARDSHLLMLCLLQVGVEVRLEPGKKYTLFPSTFKPGERERLQIVSPLLTSTLGLQ